MNFNVLLLLIFFLLINSSIISCFHGSCDPAPPHFEITGLEGYNMRFTNTGLNPWEPIEKNDTIDWENFFIRFGFHVNYIAESHFEPNGSLMALSCDPAGYAGDKIGVDTLIIRTVYDYNNNFSAGDIINPIILTNDWTFRVDDFTEFDSIQEYLINNAEGVRDDIFEIKLNEAPISSSQFAIQLTYKLNNGEEFDRTTETITLE